MLGEVFENRLQMATRQTIDSMKFISWIDAYQQQRGHSGAPPRSGGEPGIHKPGPWLWIPGCHAARGPRNDVAYDSNFKVAILGVFCSGTSACVDNPITNEL
jgi:hypothetical protein